MAVTAQMVKELREKTGAGMLDCKKALVETDGDIDAAIDYLREKGIMKAQKKADRIAAEGLCNVVVDGNDAVIYEINSETDFVARNEKFLTLLDSVGQAIIKSSAVNTESALVAPVTGGTVSDLLINATATIGEKISLRRVTRITKTDEQGFGVYLHMGGRIAALAVLEKADDEVGKNIAMHVAASNPKYLNSDQVDQETLDHEKHILTQQSLAEGKPANIVEKMVIGRLNKFLKDICLVDQPYVKDPDMTVAKYLKTNQNNVLSFIRLEVGEGFENRSCDIVEAVAELVNKK